ncbi:c-type cytochrome domain-containing protein [Occallatibacter savannae]|uniref:c-type cytochrome domain-containing protein n=1 Tax=Occallatibacter savannae TaxID=1002691 RepID=UPI000D690806|nr:c-type cytochrome domain-containing protein [Occallatibacter savannae]
MKRSAWAWVVAASVALAALPFVLRLDGRAHGDSLQFLGRFHPTLLHLPIGLIVLVPVLEIAGAKRAALREAADFVLRVALVLALPTFALGYMLAYGAGDAGGTVTRHVWGAVVLCIGLMLCIVVRPAWVAGEKKMVYPASLSVSLLALLWTGHQGGSITHGSGYLTQYAPRPLRMLIPGASAEDAGGNSFYALHIHPTLDAKCVSCHGSGSAKAGLRLDTYDDLMKGGKDGTVVVAGKPEASMLLARVTLQPGDPHFMPAEGRTPLTSEEIGWIRAWIGAGASATATSVPGVKIANVEAEPPPQPVGDYSALVPEIAQMQHGLGAKLVPVSAKASDGMILRTVDVSSSFGDAQLAEFKKFAPYIVEAELGRTAVTDASFDTLKTFTHLRALHLEGTAVTGSGLSKLSSLTQLRYLNLSGTKVTAQSVEALKKMPQLRHVYLFNTAAEGDGTTARSTP